MLIKYICLVWVVVVAIRTQYEATSTTTESPYIYTQFLFPRSQYPLFLLLNAVESSVQSCFGHPSSLTYIKKEKEKQQNNEQVS